MKYLLAILVLCSSALAGFFLDEPVVDKERSVGEVPPWRFGGTVDFGFYLSSADVGFDFSAEYRLHRNHSLDVFAGYMVGGEMLDAGADWRFFFGGHLEETGHDDFLRFGVSALYFEKDDEDFVSARITVGYGRDFLFLKNADFLCRLEVRASYIAGEPYEDDSDDAILREPPTHFIFNLSFGVFFF